MRVCFDACVCVCDAKETRDRTVTPHTRTKRTSTCTQTREHKRQTRPRPLLCTLSAFLTNSHKTTTATHEHYLTTAECPLPVAMATGLISHLHRWGCSARMDDRSAAERRPLEARAQSSFPDAPSCFGVLGLENSLSCCALNASFAFRPPRLLASLSRLPLSLFLSLTLLSKHRF